MLKRPAVPTLTTQNIALTPRETNANAHTTKHVTNMVTRAMHVAQLFHHNGEKNLGAHVVAVLWVVTHASIIRDIGSPNLLFAVLSIIYVLLVCCLLVLVACFLFHWLTLSVRCEADLGSASGQAHEERNRYPD